MLAMADGSVVEAPGYFAAVHLGTARMVGVVVTVLGDVPIVGRGLIGAFAVTLDHGLRVIVEP